MQDGRTFTGIVEDVDVKSDLASIYIIHLVLNFRYMTDRNARKFRHLN